MQVKEATSRAEREAVYKLRYAVYVREMGRAQRYADHAREQVVEPLDETGIVLYAVDDGEVIGTLRGNYAREGHLGEYESFYQLERLPYSVETLSITTKFMVRRDRRAGRAAMAMVEHIYLRALDAGIRYNVMDCNSPLLPMFKGFGFKVYLPEAEHEEYGTVSVCTLDLHDIDHLRAMRSPLAPLYEAWSAGPQAQKSA